MTAANRRHRSTLSLDGLIESEDAAREIWVRLCLLRIDLGGHEHPALRNIDQMAWRAWWAIEADRRERERFYGR